MIYVIALLVGIIFGWLLHEAVDMWHDKQEEKFYNDLP